jgi:hypothetical protein
VHVHLVLGVGTTKVVFGGFVKAIFVVLEKVRELQKLVFSVFDVSRPARPEANLERTVNLSQEDQWTQSARRAAVANLLDILNGCVLGVCHGRSRYG